MKKLILLGIAILVLISFVAYYVYTYNQDNTKELILYGNVDIREVDLGFRVTGRIDQVLVDEGDVVTPGMLVASLDNEPYLDAVSQARAQSISAKASMENAATLFNRRQELLDTHAISQEDYDIALSNKNITQANYEAAIAALETAETNLQDTQIFSPTEGWVLTRIREPGAIARVGDPVITVSIKSPVWIRAYVSERNLGRIYPGMKGLVFTDTGNGKVYSGHIGFISPVAEFTPKTVQTTQLRTDLVYRLRLIVDDPDEGLRQGMPVTVKLELDSDEAKRFEEP